MENVKELTPALTNNLELWNEVSITNPDWTKKVTYGAHHYTSINPQKQIKKATQMWGKYGSTWGLKNIRNQLIDIENKESGRMTKEIMHLVTFFYPGGEFDLSNSIPLTSYTSKGKFVIDSDAWKKIETDSLTKALSRLGFNSDVFEGNFDEEDYIKTAFYATKENGLDNVTIKASINALKQSSNAKELIALWTKKTDWHHEEAIVAVYEECLRDFQQLDQTPTK